MKHLLAELNYCVDADWFDSILDFCFIDDVLHFDELHDDQRRTNLEYKVQEDMDVATIKALDDIA